MTLADLLNSATGGLPLDALATIPDRADELAPLAQTLNMPLRLIRADELLGTETPTQSPRILAQFGTGSIAEAVALRAAGIGARLVVLRQQSTDGTATVAIAEGDGA